VAVVAALAASLMKDAYCEPVPGFSRRVKLATLGLVSLVALVAVPTVIAAAKARHSLEDARAMVERGVDAACGGDAQTARARFAAAAAAFDDARVFLDNPIVSAGLALPIVGSNLQAARDVAATGREIAHTGMQTATSVDPDRLEIVDGTVHSTSSVGSLPTSNAPLDSSGRQSSNSARSTRPFSSHR
jgi:hypothetical protein